MGFLGFLKKEHAAQPASDLQFKQEKPKDEFNAVPVPPELFKIDASPDKHQNPMEQLELPIEQPELEQTNSFEDFPPSQPDNPLTADMVPKALTETDFAVESQDEEIGPGFNQDTYPGPQDEEIPQFGGIEDMLPQMPENDNPFMEGPGGFALPDLPSSPIEETVSTAEQTFDDHQEFMPPAEKMPVTKEPMAAEAPGPQTIFAEETKPALPELPEQRPGPDVLADQGLPRIKYLQEQEADDEPDNAYINSHQFFTLLQDIKGTKKCLRDADVIMRNWGDIDQQLELQSKAIMQHVDEMQEKLITIDTELFERGE